MLKADFHIHTAEDTFVRGKSTAKEVIDTYSSLGYNVIGITNKDKVLFNPELKKYAESKGILLLPGIETKIYGKEILIINAPLGTPNNITFNQLKELHKKNTLIIAPHLYFVRKDCLKNNIHKYINHVDAIEHSHFYHPICNLNKKAIRIAKKYNKPLIGTSDYTRFNCQINKNYTLIDSKKDINSIFKAIKNKKSKLITKPLKFKHFFEIGFVTSFHVIKKEIKQLLSKPPKHL